MKKTFIIFVMTLLPFSICASDFEYNGFYYTVLSYSDKTLELSANINSSGDEVVIPSIITYGNIDFTVISIGKYAFTGCDYKSIIIPTSITAINEFAFSGSGIETFSWPSNIETMNCGMFYYCRNLKTVVLPPTLKKYMAIILLDTVELIKKGHLKNAVHWKKLFFLNPSRCWMVQHSMDANH